MTVLGVPSLQDTARGEGRLDFINGITLCPKRLVNAGLLEHWYDGWYGEWRNTVSAIRSSFDALRPVERQRRVDLLKRHHLTVIIANHIDANGRPVSSL